MFRNNNNSDLSSLGQSRSEIVNDLGGSQNDGTNIPSASENVEGASDATGGSGESRQGINRTETNQSSTNDQTNDSNNRYSFDSTFLTALTALFQRQAAAAAAASASTSASNNAASTGNSNANPGPESNTTNTRSQTQSQSQPQSGLNGLIDDAADSGAIVITINYVFSDENNPSNPNRSGSLVLTLPNNPNNRNPRMLDEFIRLATQIAYSAIVNGMQPEKRGITVEKFKSFPVVATAELDQTECSICLEEFENQDLKRSSNLDVENDIPNTKRRKLNDNSSSGVAVDEPPVSNSNGSEVTVQLLKDSTIKFPHFAVKLPCNHIFGQSCLAEWLKSNMTCPLCRTAIKDETATNPSAATNSATGFNVPPSQPPSSSDTPNVRVVDRSGEEIRFLLHNNASQGDHRIYRAQSPLSSNPSSDTTSANTSSGSGNATTSRTPSLGRQSIFNNIRDYFRSSDINEPLFPTSVESRRTATGVNTTTSEAENSPSNSRAARVSASMAVPVPRSTPNTRSHSANVAEEVLDFLNSRSLTDNHPNEENTTARNEDNGTSNSADNNNRNSNS